MPSLAKLNGTRKRHLYYRHRFGPHDFDGYHARHRALGRIASLGWAHCGVCGHKECWLDLPWCYDDVACSCGGHIGTEIRGIYRDDLAWRDRKGIVHAVEIDHKSGTITSCRQPLEPHRDVLHSFAGDAAPTCVWCACAGVVAA